VGIVAQILQQRAQAGRHRVHLLARAAGRLLDAVLLHLRLPLMLVPHFGHLSYPVDAFRTHHCSDRQPPFRTIGRSRI
jgi:hypothetical protein